MSRRPRARAEETPQTTPGFDVHLENFEGPFDLLLQLISRRELDVTRVALSQVTDEFIAHVRAAGDALGLEQTSSFLVVAATLLDLKAARLLPGGEVTEPEDLAALEARDLLFARLLQYRAFKQLAAWVEGTMAETGSRGAAHPPARQPRQRRGADRGRRGTAGREGAAHLPVPGSGL